MNKLRLYLEPVVNRQRSWRKWRALAWCWGLLAVAACLAVAFSRNLDGWPENSVAERLALLLLALSKCLRLLVLLVLLRFERSLLRFGSRVGITRLLQSGL